MAYALNASRSRPMHSAVSRNALLHGASSPHGNSAPPSAPSIAAALITNAIAHAAMLSDTPEKWTATLDMLRRNGIDPSGYEDFKKGRALAIAAGDGTAPEPAEEAEYQR